MKSANKTLQQLLTYYKQISLLSKAKAVLDWDLNVNLPPLAAQSRAEQTTYLTELITEKWLDKEFRKLLEEVRSAPHLSTEEKAVVRNLSYAAKFYYNVPKQVIAKQNEVTSVAFVAWNKARSDKNFKAFLPHLTKIIDLNRQIADYLGYKDNPYDALLDLYEPELTALYTKNVFAGLKTELTQLIKKIQKSKLYNQEVTFINPQITYREETQERLSKWVTTLMGYNLQAGRIDVSPHPFTTGFDPTDVRVTTHYNTHDFRDAFTSSIHEAGHALYEQGVTKDYTYTPLESGVSMGIHEAMSRFWENMVGKNPLFLSFATPILHSAFPDQLQQVSQDQLIYSFNVVKPSLIRIYADEVTYSLHIILRFEMENALINGKIQPKDAAEAWAEKSKKYFGISPKDDSEGVLQDVHWSYGAFGYFPSYALGNLYGAQILQTMKKTVKFDDSVKNGDLLPIKTWLDRNIHQYGSLYFPKELIKKVTGKELTHTYFVDYLTKKYTSLYNL